MTYRTPHAGVMEAPGRRARGLASSARAGGGSGGHGSSGSCGARDDHGMPRIKPLTHAGAARHPRAERLLHHRVPGDGRRLQLPCQGPLLVVHPGHGDQGGKGAQDRGGPAFIEESRAVTRERIEERIRPIARTFPPYRAAEAEERLNQEIVDCLNDGDVRVKVRAWVDVCDPVREDLQKVWRQRLVVDADGDMKKAYVETPRRAAGGVATAPAGRRPGGIGAVPEAKTAWLAPYALALAQDPKNAADYLKGALEQRVDHTEKLLSDLGAMVVDDRMEAIEFAFQSDSALRRLLTYLGVPIPPKTASTPNRGCQPWLSTRSGGLAAVIALLMCAAACGNFGADQPLRQEGGLPVAERAARTPVRVGPSPTPS